MQYILASASPRRRELLSKILNNFSIFPAQLEERVDFSLSPEQIVCSLAEQKCDEVFNKFISSVVIGCDTIVVYQGKILGKPKSKQDAINTLTMLSGKTHSVITGVCIQNENKKLISFNKTEVKFNTLSEKFIFDYVEGGSPMDKAGSYGIQDEGIVEKYFGSYTNVVGMPVELVEKMLKEVEE
ncbi:MAG: septum formation protein Maf [Clostridiales bacterium]|nr:septum formation protein Maf [Clostridiales bacterium]